MNRNEAIVHFARLYTLMKMYDARDCNLLAKQISNRIEAERDKFNLADYEMTKQILEMAGNVEDHLMDLLCNQDNFKHLVQNDVETV